MKRASTNRLFRAFADETRLRLLHLLTRGELCVCDLKSVLNLPQSKISRHLAYLRQAGLVRSRREGLWKHYSLTTPETRFHRKLIECLGQCFEDVEVLRKDLKILKQKRPGAC